MRLVVLLVSVLCLVSGVPLVALQPDSPWETFGKDQGLSGSSVTGIAQDSRGFLWFSTQSGLNRWDGYTMRLWQKEPFSQNTLSHNLIQTLYNDGGTVLWLGTYNGLDRFDIETETFTSFHHRTSDPGSLSHNVVTRVYRDSHGTLWVGTLDGLNRLDEKSGVFRVYPYAPGFGGLSGRTVRSLVEDGQGRLWVATNEGLDFYDQDSDRMVAVSKVFPRAGVPSGAIMATLRLPGDPYLWLAVWNQGLVRFDPRSGDSRLFRLSDPRLFSLDSGEPGELLVGTWGGGLCVFRPATGDKFTFRHNAHDPESLAQDVVYQSFIDRGGLLWVATNGGGLSRFNPRRQQFQELKTEGKVTVLRESRDGSLWAGIYDHGLVQIGPDGLVRRWAHDAWNPHSLSNDILNGITEDSRGLLWILTNQGVNLLDPLTGQMTPWSLDPSIPGALPDEVVNCLTIDRAGSYWFGTYRSGLVRRPRPGTPGTTRHYLSDPLSATSLPDNLVYFVSEDREGRLWVGTNGGLALYQPATDNFQVWRYDPQDRHSLPSNTVRCLLEDSKGRFWVVTNGGGLSLLDLSTGKFRNFGLEEGLSSLSCYSLLEDDSGTLWITSANGLFSFDPQTQRVRPFGTADGLSSVEFSSGATKATGGRLVFGGLQAILTLRPTQLSLSTLRPLVALTALQVAGKPRVITHHLTLGWQENSLTVSFAALDFRNPGKNLYAYRLDGFDRDWVQAGSRHEATYTNLWPGSYRFRVMGADSTGLWAESSETVTVEVEPAPWVSWYAVMLYVALLALVAYLFQKARISISLGQKVAELETLRRQLEEVNLRLDQLARLDGLTGIPNRRALDLWLAEEWARAQRQKQSVALMMLDIDDFKRFNDYYGHLEGDTCLKAVANALSQNLHRTTDFCGRYGGEEFVIVLQDTDLEGAVRVAERMLASIDALEIPHAVSTATPTVSISVGVASEIPGPETSLESLMRHADQALYRAKAQGRHRVETS